MWGQWAWNTFYSPLARFTLEHPFTANSFGAAAWPYFPFTWRCLVVHGLRALLLLHIASGSLYPQGLRGALEKVVSLHRNVLSAVFYLQLFSSIVSHSFMHFSVDCFSRYFCVCMFINYARWTFSCWLPCTYFIFTSVSWLAARNRIRFHCNRVLRSFNEHIELCRHEFQRNRLIWFAGIRSVCDQGRSLCTVNPQKSTRVVVSLVLLPRYICCFWSSSSAPSLTCFTSARQSPVQPVGARLSLRRSSKSAPATLTVPDPGFSTCDFGFCWCEIILELRRKDDDWASGVGLPGSERSFGGTSLAACRPCFWMCPCRIDQTGWKLLIHDVHPHSSTFICVMKSACLHASDEMSYQRMNQLK